MGEHVFIGSDVAVGRDTVIEHNVTVTGRVLIGARVRIGSGSAIGCEGFGYEQEAGRYRHIPHTGEVVIEDDVDIGANVTVARAKAGRQTRIGRGTKIDCQVHIAHNVLIGEDCVIAAQTGIAGSARIGNRVKIGGQVGIRDHVRIGDDAVIHARSAVFRSVPAREQYSGMPARPHAQTVRFWARLWRRNSGGR